MGFASHADFVPAFTSDYCCRRQRCTTGGLSQNRRGRFATGFEAGGAQVTEQVGDGSAISPSRVIPEATVARLAVYLRVLSAGVVLGNRGTVSSQELATAAGVNPAKLRKDLSHLGSHGIRGVGYDVATLTDEIGRTLGAHQVNPVALVGVGHLGSALAGYSGFSGRGFPICALFDVDPAKIGRTVAGLVVTDFAEAGPVCRAASITIGVIATPEAAAQPVADVLVAAGVRSILNFAPGLLDVPGDVELRRVDLALELQMLAFYESRRACRTSNAIQAMS